jgi:hypothetical protein
MAALFLATLFRFRMGHWTVGLHNLVATICGLEEVPICWASSIARGSRCAIC